jgi:hypothetical protein
VPASGVYPLDVQLPLPSAMVLFGPNDSGKTNVLEGLVTGLDELRDVRAQPLLAGRAPVDEVAVIDLLFELDGLDVEGHPHQELFLSFMPLHGGIEGWWAQPVDESDEQGRLAEDARIVVR